MARAERNRDQNVSGNWRMESLLSFGISYCETLPEGAGSDSCYVVHNTWDDKGISEIQVCHQVLMSSSKHPWETCQSQDDDRGLSLLGDSPMHCLVAGDVAFHYAHAVSRGIIALASEFAIWISAIGITVASRQGLKNIGGSNQPRLSHGKRRIFGMERNLSPSRSQLSLWTGFASSMAPPKAYHAFQ